MSKFDYRNREKGVVSDRSSINPVDYWRLNSSREIAIIKSKALDFCYHIDERHMSPEFQDYDADEILDVLIDLAQNVNTRITKIGAKVHKEQGIHFSVEFVREKKRWGFFFGSTKNFSSLFLLESITDTDIMFRDSHDFNLVAGRRLVETVATHYAAVVQEYFKLDTE